MNMWSMTFKLIIVALTPVGLDKKCFNLKRGETLGPHHFLLVVKNLTMSTNVYDTKLKYSLLSLTILQSYHLWEEKHKILYCIVYFQG